MKQIHKLLLILGIFFLTQRLFWGNVLESAIGRLKCGDRYLKSVDGIAGDVSCGFNIDMFLSALGIFLFLVGAVLSLTTHFRATK